MAILKGIISQLNGSAGNLTFKQLGGPLALRAFQRLKPVPTACGGPFALRAFQRAGGPVQRRFARSR